VGFEPMNCPYGHKARKETTLEIAEMYGTHTVHNIQGTVKSLKNCGKDFSLKNERKKCCGFPGITSNSFTGSGLMSTLSTM